MQNEQVNFVRYGKRRAWAGWLKRLVRRFVVPRREYDQALDALNAARSLIVRHHEASVTQRAGHFCPVCHRPDGSEPEIDQIFNALHTPNAQAEARHRMPLPQAPGSAQKEDK